MAAEGRPGVAALACQCDACCPHSCAAAHRLHATLPWPPQEHPFLRRPFFQQHPCQTDAVMRLLRGQGDASGDGTAAGSAGGRSAAAPSLLRYMLAWLSVAGPPLGLRVPLDLWRAVER